MRTRQRVNRALAAATLVAAAVGVGAGASPAAAQNGGATEYTVLAADNVSAADAIAAIEQAGGRVVERNDAVGMFRAVGPDSGFVDRVSSSSKLFGAAHVTSIGQAPAQKPKTRTPDAEKEGRGAGAASTAATQARTSGMDPLDDKLWGLRMVKSDQARKVTAGDKRVTVGILDTGVDASNPDIADNFNWKLSRNFAKDIPEVDGPCEVEKCLDPVGTDDGGHGTHVAGTVGAAANGFGLSGVAPNVSLVELKGGQDSGYFFLEPVVNALTYAGDAGIDVVNMSFYVDPWLYNCTANPADSPGAQAEQRTIIRAMTRALTYAHNRGVTLVGALGNNHEDLGSPRTDTSSPDYPQGAEYSRPIDNGSCLDLPVEGPYVIGVSALGPSGTKADYSNYGTEQISVSAPGGWFRDGVGTATFRTDGNMILSTYPKKVLQEEGSVDADGNVVPAAAGSVFKECTKNGRCGYYSYLQGTSMASPHAAGVAALIVSRFGKPSRDGRTITMSPSAVESVLINTAAERACPEPRLRSYLPEGRSTEFDAYCSGDEEFNGFYGHGIVDAYAAVTAGHVED
ncbi:S8 family serine peptidase [Planosporangium flavigriseum]|uniref:Serine protease n=1 Tax=Planosporangium flavigriseum TaxID=373681 RepID=A0A8J3PNB7_9ACTN|nr:S8 family serine peptidase [Planosporangium flavigriseum]NJC67697.1 S8 family serine peptidase [Planosporangium flavigriseum]GIG75827.1 serine protease [Planosporangium flavigriseum]